MTLATHFTEQDIICNDSLVQVILFSSEFYSTNEMVKFYFKIIFYILAIKQESSELLAVAFMVKTDHSQKV